MPVSCENSTVQVKHSSKQAIFSHAKQNENMSHVWDNGIHMASKILHYFFIIHGQWAVKIQDVWIFHCYRWNSQKKATVITSNSLKTRNSLPMNSGFLSYDFLPCTYFSVTHGIMLEKQGRQCVFQLMRLTKCLGWVWSIKVFEMKIQIRMAKTTKCKMLPMVHFCHLKKQAKSFWQLLVYACIFCSVCLEMKIQSLVCRVNTK